MSVEGQQEAKSLQPNKTSHTTLTYNSTPRRDWPSTSTFFYNTLSSLLLANSGLISHIVMAPGTRRVLINQQNTPKTSVKIYGDVSLIQKY